MRKFVFSFLLLAIATTAQARSLQGVKLEYSITPFKGFISHMESGESTQVMVLNGGRVMGYTCRDVGMADVEPCTSTEITRLDSYSMDRIDRLIERSRVGALIGPDPNSVVCLAIPTESRTFSADNGRITLETGSYPCGGHFFNDTRASLDLVNMLRNYMSQYKKLNNR